jgi:hypothetical protein
MKIIISLFSLIVLFSIGCTTPGISAALPSQSTELPSQSAVILSQPPEIIMVSVTPASISPGQSATVTWSITNADNIIMVPGIGNVASSGTQEVKPIETTEYTITAKNKYGTTEEKIKVNVEIPIQLSLNLQPSQSNTSTNLTALPKIILFSADPEYVDAGSPVVFTWNVINATSIIIDNDIDDDRYVSKKGSDDMVLLPLINKVFRLRAENANGVSQATVIITMKPSIPSGDDENRPSGPCG